MAGTGGGGGRGGSSGSGDAPPSLTGCEEYHLHASPSCSIGAPDDVPVVELAFSPDGRYLVTAATGAVKVWTLNGNAPVAEGHVLTGSGFGVIAFSPSGSTLAVGWKGSIELWDVGSWTKQQTLSIASSSNEVYDVGFSPDGQQVISIDINTTSRIGNLYLHAVTAPPALRSVSLTGPWALSVSPLSTAGGSLAAVSTDAGTVEVYTVASSGITGPTVLAATSGSTAYAVRFSPDGRLLASGGGSDGLVHFWNVPLTSTVAVAPDIDIQAGTGSWSDDVEALAFSPRGDSIAVGGGFFGSITTWNEAPPRGMLAKNTTPTWDIASIALSPSGGMLAAGEYDCGLVMICGN
jgi:WD40 repeat protein